MATINGAKAINRDDTIGSLETGKAADIIAIKVDPIDHLPMYDPISQLIYTHNGHRVSHSWVAGKLLMNERQLTTLNEREVIANTQEWQKTIQENN
jgi:5-methylthioadenosine/S-adenosylhomocysteine deaminase